MALTILLSHSSSSSSPTYSTFILYFFMFSYFLAYFHLLFSSLFFLPCFLLWSCYVTFSTFLIYSSVFNPLNAELNPICPLLSLFGAHHILHISRLRVNFYLISVLNFHSPFIFVLLSHSRLFHSFFPQYKSITIF